MTRFRLECLRLINQGRSAGMAYPHSRPVSLDDLGCIPYDALRLEDAWLHKAKSPVAAARDDTYRGCTADSLTTGDIVDYVCKEIEWVRGQLS